MNNKLVLKYLFLFALSISALSFSAHAQVAKSKAQVQTPANKPVNEKESKKAGVDSKAGTAPVQVPSSALPVENRPAKKGLSKQPTESKKDGTMPVRLVKPTLRDSIEKI